jgi:hypothetical protein
MSAYRVTFHDGTTEEHDGELLLIEGTVLTIEDRGDGGALWEQTSYPLTSLRKWEYVR